MSVLFPSLPKCSPSAKGHFCPRHCPEMEKLQLEVSLCVREEKKDDASAIFIPNPVLVLL